MLRAVLCLLRLGGAAWAQHSTAGGIRQAGAPNPASAAGMRLGAFALPNVIGTRTGVPRSQRLCPLCQSPYSDERHTLLECTALSPLREKYQQLFCPHVNMRQFMWQNDLPQLARFVIECLQFLAAAQSTG